MSSPRQGPWRIREAPGGSLWVEYHGPREMRVVSDPLSYLTMERAKAVRDALNATEYAESAAHRKIIMEPRRLTSPSGEGRNQ